MKLDFSNRQIENAITAIDKNPELRHNRESQKYDLIHKGKPYPPILVLSEANKINGGEELLLSDFGNSTKKPFNILKNYGFTIKKKDAQKEDFTPLINKYLEQAKTNSLKTSDYSRRYKNLTVKVSFGQGTPTHVPWISFLGEGQSTSNGIYPVFLYYKKQKILVLAYGISESNEPSISWELDAPQTVNELFHEKKWGEPYRYGSSLVYSHYNLSNNFSPIKINEDLDHIIHYYKNFLLTQNFPGINNKKLDLSKFTNNCQKANLIFNPKLCDRFIYSLCTKPFLILTGLSGSGKTKIAQAFSTWICKSKKQINLVPVGADWTNREPLVGYPNALEKESYVKPENGVLDLILRASVNQGQPYFLILDEMNLSHVERYFADFLSAMESGEEIQLHSGEGEWNGVPPSIKVPKNLFVIGTVNIDETTYMFSPKVLDRANVIEFRVKAEEIEKFLQKPNDIELISINGKGAAMAEDFVNRSTNPAPKIKEEEKFNKELLNFFNELKQVGAEYGYRSAFEMYRFAGIADDLVEDWSTNEILDIAIIQKLLPKLHGSRRKLEPVLKTLAKLCMVANGNEADKALEKPNEFNFSDDVVKYPISLEKIARMHKRLLENGFTSFAEA